MQEPDIPPTEQTHPLSRDLDRMDARGIVALLIEEEARSVAALPSVADSVARIAVLAARSLERGGRLIYVGAGTSGRLGVLDAVECVPTFRSTPQQVVGVMAGGPEALTRAVEGAEDDSDAGAAALTALDIGPRDTVVGIAASGRTPFVLAALQEAARRGAATACVTAGGQVNLPCVGETVCMPVGPEVLAGSTRLKAGTATKIILNAISTAAMVLIGKVHGNLMVDLRPTNAKLRARACRMTSQLAGVDLPRARDTLCACDWEVKTAVLALRTGLSIPAARARLAGCRGVLRKALGAAESAAPDL